MIFLLALIFCFSVCMNVFEKFGDALYDKGHPFPTFNIIMNLIFLLGAVVSSYFILTRLYGM